MCPTEKEHKRYYEKNKTNYDVLCDLGIVYGMRGDARNALDYSLQALKINDKDPSLFYNIAISYQNLGDAEKAKEYMAKADKLKASASDSTRKE